MKMTADLDKLSKEDAEDLLDVEVMTMSEFKKSMEGIYTTSVSTNTLDEAPMAYKAIDDIIKNIHPTAEIIKRIKPVYNFKSPN